MIGTAAAWCALGAAAVLAGRLLGAAGIPSAYLFAALVAGLVAALWRPGRFELPDRASSAAQAVCGVVLGAFLRPSSLEAIAGSWLPVALVSSGTLAVCLAAGAVLARLTDVDGPTAALGMVAGGATGIVAMARGLGGDDRLVAFMQYARVLVIVLITPVLAALLFPGGGAPVAAGPEEALFAGGRDWLITLACAPAGVLLARLVRLPAGVLLGPMVLAAALTLTGALGPFTVPSLVREASFIVIGLQVGLGFTVRAVRQIGRLLVPVLVAIAGLIVACFGLAVVLHHSAGVPLEDAYLATTPGGLYAVLAVAFGTGADTTFILAVQGLRLLVMVLLAPLIVRATVRPPATMRA